MEPFVPAELPLTDIDWAELVPQISTANAALARYDGMMKSVINPQVLLSPLTVREAVLSSRIEGTQSTIEEVLKVEADTGNHVEASRRDEIQEVINYRRAMREAVQILENLPLCLRVLKKLHAILLDSVRGKEQTPGEFRTDQNWIGPKGCPIERATFVPPAPDVMRKALHNWEEYCHYEEKDRLVQLAVVKAQFEIIHPFRDGNGRIGRMLVPLFLYEKQLLKEPMFYISEYFEEHDEEYRGRLSAISKDGDWIGWIKFFLTAIQMQAGSNTTKVEGIVDLYTAMKARVSEVTHSQYSIHALDAMFTQPIFRRSIFHKSSNIPSRQTADSILRSLLEVDILKELEPGGGRRSAILCFPALINLVEGRKVV